jgi:hypothetical protein
VGTAAPFKGKLFNHQTRIFWSSKNIFRFVHGLLTHDSRLLNLRCPNPANTQGLCSKSRRLIVFTPRFFSLGLLVLALTNLFTATSAAQSSSKIQHVLLISIDGMHSLDFANCTKGVPNFGNQPYCPHLASLSATGVHYLQALTPKPSDSFPGLVAQITGATPRSAGVFYDVSYDRALSPPAKTPAV